MPVRFGTRQRLHADFCFENKNNTREAGYLKQRAASTGNYFKSTPPISENRLRNILTVPSQFIVIVSKGKSA